MASYELLNCQLVVYPKGLEAFKILLYLQIQRCYMDEPIRSPWGIYFRVNIILNVLLNQFLCRGEIKSLGNKTLALR